MVANIGLRMDYFDSRTKWFENEYDYVFTPDGKDGIHDAKSKSADSQIKISPRIGISHPITTTSKVYFNYGHFYSLPMNMDLYRVNTGAPSKPVNFIGNPELDMQKTIAYEVGYDQELFNSYSLHFSGYYRDISDQVANVYYHGIDGLVGYGTRENNNYEDVKGFEIELRKRHGKWFTGWINYEYKLQQWGYTGRLDNYQDPIKNAQEGKYEITQDLADARPELKANMTFIIPETYGPVLGGYNFSFLFTWEDGQTFTWDPEEKNLPETQNNLEWKDYFMLDAKFDKSFKLGDTKLVLYGNINNLLDIKYFSVWSRAFASTGQEWENYMESLKLDIYDGNEDLYGDRESGNDTPGDVDKDHINMPDPAFERYTNPRYFTLGIKLEF
jgi:hypothetical protein